jgi:transcription initiation factor TFIIB
LNLPRNVLETASMIYRKALKKNMIKGRSIVGVVVAALYMACRMCGVLRSLTDVAETSNISRKIAARNYRLLHLKLGLDVPIVKRTGYINRLVSRLRLPGYIEMLSLRLMEEASKNNLTLGRSPAGLAAACIYISGCIMGERLTQHQVALEAQVTEVTIRNRYKELLRNIDIEIQI